MKSFTLSARVDSESSDLVEPVLKAFVKGSGSVKREGNAFVVTAEMQGGSSKELNRTLLSALRRAEKKTRLRAEWTSSGMTERYFDYVLKKTVKAPSGLTRP